MTGQGTLTETDMQQRTQRSGTERTYVNTRDVPKLGYFLEYVRKVLSENGSSAIVGGYQSHTHQHDPSSTWAWPEIGYLINLCLETL